MPTARLGTSISVNETDQGPSIQLDVESACWTVEPLYLLDRCRITGHTNFLLEDSCQCIAAGLPQLGKAKATMLPPEGASFLPPPQTITTYSRPLI